MRSRNEKLKVRGFIQNFSTEYITVALADFFFNILLHTKVAYYFPSYNKEARKCEGILYVIK